MLRVNRDLNAWGISLLEVGPADRVLEVGFGPGWAMRRLAKIAVDGLVAGMDHSALMVRQARRRNSAAVQAGRVALCLGSAAAIPLSDESFDKVYSANSLSFWAEPIACLWELRRAMKPGGTIVAALQPRRVNGQERKEIGEKVAGQMACAGFRDVRLEFKDIRPVPAICVVGLK
jgi:ubiquinone/menaquinone biosynthesis C-methylase UbiE